MIIRIFYKKSTFEKGVRPKLCEKSEANTADFWCDQILDAKEVNAFLKKKVGENITVRRNAKWHPSTSNGMEGYSIPLFIGRNNIVEEFEI